MNDLKFDRNDTFSKRFHISCMCIDNSDTAIDTRSDGKKKQLASIPIFICSLK